MGRSTQGQNPSVWPCRVTWLSTVWNSQDLSDMSKTHSHRWELLWLLLSYWAPKRQADFSCFQFLAVSIEQGFSTSAPFRSGARWWFVVGDCPVLWGATLFPYKFSGYSLQIKLIKDEYEEQFNCKHLHKSSQRKETQRGGQMIEVYIPSLAKQRKRNFGLLGRRGKL